MADDEENKLVSLSGQPIWHHDKPEKEWQPPPEEMCLEEISAHIERHIGKIDTVFHELVSDTVHIDIHHVAPNEDRPLHTLITSGMSDLPMKTPSDETPRYLELLIHLPPDWRISQEAFDDESWYWPIRQLKYLARFPHKLDTFLGYGHTIPNGDPPEPYAKNTKLNCILILPPLSTPEAFDQLVIDENKTIHFMAIVPLYQEETDLKLRKGTGELLEKFSENDITDVLDIGRPNVAKKRFLFF